MKHYPNAGIYHEQSDGNKIADNSIIGGGIGIYLIKSDENTLEWNNISHNIQNGISIWDSNLGLAGDINCLLAPLP